MKTGLILAALTFLAIQSGDLISLGLSRHASFMQDISVFSLVLGGILAVWELWPRDYLREAKPEKYYT